MGSEYVERNIKDDGGEIPWTRVLFCEIYESGTNIIICITYSYTHYVHRWRNPRSSPASRLFECIIWYYTQSIYRVVNKNSTQSDSIVEDENVFFHPSCDVIQEWNYYSLINNVKISNTVLIQGNYRSIKLNIP